jgi:hypothetical protein
MAGKNIKLSTLKPNPGNPRFIKDEKFKKLCDSIQAFPKMMELRPIIIDEGNIILGGNMRFNALKHLGYKELPVEWVKQANELTEEQKQEFIVKDNVGFGEWDWDILANEWDTEKLEEWGLDLPGFAPDVDYSILDDEDVEGQLNDMTNGVKKAIQIEFEAEHYEEAYELVKFWREQGGYIGGMIMEFLKAEKENL